MRKSVKIVDAGDEAVEDDEYFDAIEDTSVDIKAITLPRRPARYSKPLQ